MLEHHRQPLLPKREFLRRIALYAAGAFLLVGVSLLIGILGYHEFEGMPWLDSLLNAAMILGGMGPVDQIYTNGGKWFASFYALFSGIVFLISVGVLMAPVIHRLMHQFHIKAEEDENK